MCIRDRTNYARLRFGIGAAYSKGRQIDFVLQPWKKDEAKSLPFVIDRAAQATWCFLTEGIQSAMNGFNGNALEL